MRHTRLMLFIGVVGLHGGLSRRLILLKGGELSAMVPACETEPVIRTHPTASVIRS
jgi:hypothetical protein